MSRIYYRGAQAAVVCYDLTDPGSFERARFWVSELRKHEEECQIYLCGTKLDLVTGSDHLDQRKVAETSVRQLARETSSDVFETSSKTGQGVGDLFTKVAADYLLAQERAASSAGRRSNDVGGGGGLDLDLGSRHHSLREKCAC